MADTRVLGNDFETTEGGLHLHNRLVKTKKVNVSITALVESYAIQTIMASAKIIRIVFVMPALTADNVTAVISVINSDGITIYESSACGESDTHILSPDPAIPIIGTNTIMLTLNKAPGGTGTVNFVAYLEGRD